MIISALQQSSSDAIPCKKFNFFKFWWDSELDTLKSKSIASHTAWVQDGKPKSGSFYLEMITCKFEYKSMIKTKEQTSKNQFSDELNDALLNKNTTTFWKCWKSKFNNKTKSQMINGENEPDRICNQFSKFFSAIQYIHPVP